MHKIAQIGKKMQKRSTLHLLCPFGASTTADAKTCNGCNVKTKGQAQCCTSLVLLIYGQGCACRASKTRDATKQNKG